MGIGAWEIQKPEVLVAILTRELVSTKWAIGFRNLQIPTNGVAAFFSGMPFDHARNTAVQRMLEHSFKWLLFIDDDVIPPADVFQKLSAHNHDIISGLYYRRANPICPVMLEETKSGPAWITKFVAGSVIEADLVGAGCLLIRDTVIRSMPFPWFDWLLDRYDLPERERCSEDFAFCRKAKRMGHKIYVDTGVQCGHVGLGVSTIGGNFTPCNV